VSFTLDTNSMCRRWNLAASGRGSSGWPTPAPSGSTYPNAILGELVTVLRDDFAWEGYRLHALREQIGKITNRITPTRSLDVVKGDPDDNFAFLSARSLLARSSS
jgi:hypothetical protein